MERYRLYLTQKHGKREPGKGEARDRYTRWPYKYWDVDRMMLRAQRQRLSMPHHNEAGEYAFPAEDSLTAWTAGQTIDFLKSKPQAPFSVTCSILHPHAPLLATRPYSRHYDPKAMPMPKVLDDVFTPAERRAIPKVLTLTPEGLGSFISLYYGLVKEVDDWVGKILDALDESGHADNTLVIFTSDHGEMLGDHSRVSKMVFYEASLRVPMILRLPGRIAPGQRLDCTASGADLAPTILDYAGIPVPSNMQGRSLRGVMEGGKDDREFAYADLGAEALRRPNAQRMYRSGEWKFAFWGGRAWLYNLQDDPDETRNLLDPKHRNDKWIEQGRRIKKHMLDWLNSQGSEAVETLRGWEV